MRVRDLLEELGRLDPDLFVATEIPNPELDLDDDEGQSWEPTYVVGVTRYPTVVLLETERPT